MDEDRVPAPTLDDLRGLHLPEEISRAPQTLGWWILLGLVALVLLMVAFLLWRRWQTRRYRREAHAELRRLAEDLEDSEHRARVARELPALVKRVALVAWPRGEVADLTEDAWLAFLDRSQGGTAFTQGAGRLLPTLAYASRPPEPDQLRELLGVVSTWIDEHHVRA